MRVKGLTGVVAVSLLALLGACREGGGELEITRFEANPQAITATGQAVTLSWDISGPVTGLEINSSVGQSPGEVTGNDVMVNPTATTTYTLRASNASSEDEATTTVTLGGTGGEDGKPPTGSFGVALTQTGEFQSDSGGNITSPSDPRIIRVQPGGTFYASATYSDPGGVADMTVYIANSSPPGLKADLVPGQSVGGFTVSEPTGCTLDGTQVSVTCLYTVQVGNIPNIDELPDAGSEFAYVLKLRASDPAGNSDDQSTRGYVIVGEGGGTPPPPPGNEAPVAAFTSEQTGSSEDGVTYSFSAAGSSDPDGDSLSYAWNFGDGSSATTRDFTKTYAEDGSYTVTLTVSDGNGGSDSASETLSVGDNQAPVASFVYNPETVVVNETAVTFDASASSDADGTVASYAWKTTSPSGDIDNFTKDGTAPTLRLKFKEVGTYTASLVVTDNTGASSEAVAQTLEVLAEAPEGNELTVNVAGDGSVKSTPSGIACLGDCSETYVAGTPVTLTATPDEDAALVGWGGACSETDGDVCTVTMDEAEIVTVTFSEASGADPTLTFTQSTAGGGTGEVTSNPAGISCNNECVSDAATFAPDTAVTLTAEPDAGSIFERWTGDCDSVDENTCIVSMDESKTVSAIFGTEMASSSLKVDFEAVVSGSSVFLTSTSEGSDIASYLWEFGDGLIGGGSRAKHRYREDGTYAVKLTVRDERRNRASVSKNVVVPG